MVKKQQSKRQRNIKSKLMAAICMLLVSTIMMVSSTYAWFTLSTAPEVTGITTAVGANGNLEMALVPKTGPSTTITSSAGDSVAAIETRNTTWGNLVDLSDTTIYGLDKIKLFPSAINIDDAGKLVTTALLQTPTYGSDGRVSELVANTVTSYFDKQTGTFTQNDDYGVRAVGTASGMTDRQLDYRNARAAANTAAAQAKNAASASLNDNGSALANIAIKRGTAGTSATFDQTDIASLNNIVNDLLGTDTKTGALEYIETAYLQSILAYAASAATGTEETVWSAVKGAVEASNATLDSVITAIGEGNLPDTLTTAIGKYETTLSNVEDAKTKLASLTGTSISWTDLSPVLKLLADPDKMEVNGIQASDIMTGDNMSTLVNSVASGGLVVTIASGGGVYADIADQCGDYTASVTIKEVTYNGLTLKNMSAKMTTDTDLATPYLDAIATAIGEAKAPSSGTDADMPVTDMYGYVIDLAFRTNAADSSLMLQVEAADRIYSDNTNEDTMGNGSSMTFASTTNDFSNDQVKALMSAIRLVFFSPLDGTIYVNGKLDVTNATVGADGVTAEMYLYTGSAEDATAVNYVKVTDGTGTHKQVVTTTYEQLTGDALTSYTGTKYSQDAADPTKYNADENGTYKQVVTYTYSPLTEDEKTSYTGDRYKEVTGESAKTDNIIMPLTQNQQTPLSVLVYLDGNNMGNDDVAATAATSMTGTMNIQFASTATLVPMEYASLHIPEGGSNTGSGTTTNYTVSASTASADYTVSDAAYADGKISFKLANTAGAIESGNVTVAVDGGTGETASFADGVWSVTKTLTANATIVVTYTA